MNEQPIQSTNIQEAVAQIPKYNYKNQKLNGDISAMREYANNPLVVMGQLVNEKGEILEEHRYALCLMPRSYKAFDTITLIGIDTDVSWNVPIGQLLKGLLNIQDSEGSLNITMHEHLYLLGSISNLITPPSRAGQDIAKSILVRAGIV